MKKIMRSSEKIKKMLDKMIVSLRKILKKLCCCCIKKKKKILLDFEHNDTTEIGNITDFVL